MRSGGGMIDFVRQDDLVENRSLLEFETSTHGIVNIDPDDIGGNEAGSELNTFETASERFCERFGKCGLAGARNIFDQRVPAAQVVRSVHTRSWKGPGALLSHCTFCVHVVWYMHCLYRRLPYWCYY